MAKLKLYLRRSLILIVLCGIFFVIAKLFMLIFTPEEALVVAPKEAVPVIKKNAVALTFDDGPHPAFTLRLLDVLDKNNVKATFFVVGKQVKKYPEFLREIKKSGHDIENHTFNHPFLPTLDKAGVIKELELNKEEIRKAAGVEPVFFRPPYGRYDEKVIDAALSRGFFAVLWSISGADYGATDPDVIKMKVLSGLKDGDIILLHSGVEATLKALPEIIAEIKNRGFEFKKVSDLIKLDNELSNKAVYIYKNSEPFILAVR